MQKKKIVIMAVNVLVPIILILAGLIFYRWNRYANKNSLVQKYVVDNTKEIYIMGTIGKKHFNRINNYSMEDMLNVIDNVNPDIVMLLAREDHRLNYNIVDGDIDACVAYSYCFDKNIPVKMIDWWIIDNIYPEDSATNLRDDNIFIKISRTLRESKPDSRVLIILNSKNFYEAIARFKISGYIKQPIEKDDLANLFVSNKEEGEKFKFPPLASKTWKDRSYFYAYVLPRIVNDNPELFDSVKERIVNSNHDKFYRREIEYCKYLNNNILYK